MNDFGAEFPAFIEGAAPSPPRTKQLPKRKDNAQSTGFNRFRNVRVADRYDKDTRGRGLHRDRP